MGVEKSTTRVVARSGPGEHLVDPQCSAFQSMVATEDEGRKPTWAADKGVRDPNPRSALGQAQHIVPFPHQAGTWPLKMLAAQLDAEGVASC